MPNNRKWTEEEDLVVVGIEPMTEIAKKLDRTYSAVIQRRKMIRARRLEASTIERSRKAREEDGRAPIDRVLPRIPGAGSCSYCSGATSCDCTCDQGDRCRDDFCLYYSGQKSRTKNQKKK